MENLFEVISVRNLLKVIKGKKMGYDRKNLFIVFRPDSTLDPEKLVGFVRSGGKDVKLTPDHKLTVSLPGLKPDEIAGQAKGLLRSLMH
jgi:transcription-repair coupling factor (superfamily II helicase)